MFPRRKGKHDAGEHLGNVRSTQHSLWTKLWISERISEQFRKCIWEHEVFALLYFLRITLPESLCPNQRGLHSPSISLGRAVYLGRCLMRKPSILITNFSLIKEKLQFSFLKKAGKGSPKNNKTISSPNNLLVTLLGIKVEAVPWVMILHCFIISWIITFLFHKLPATFLQWVFLFPRTPSLCLLKTF